MYRHLLTFITRDDLREIRNKVGITSESQQRKILAGKSRNLKFIDLLVSKAQTRMAQYKATVQMVDDLNKLSSI